MSKLSKLNKIKTNRKKSKIRKEDLKKLRINSFANKTYRTIDNFLGCIGFMNMKEYKTALHIGDYDIDNMYNTIVLFTKGGWIKIYSGKMFEDENGFISRRILKPFELMFKTKDRSKALFEYINACRNKEELNL